ncbi:MarR family winged helix-turn-helix transcriptional regulator [Ralstonia insidiosa]|uniref:MarR family transcriptional regulator n=1 Tax=Ralstonia insidiosa TaxID=190721 RepID=A0A192A6R1_9RALS|nr:MarR family winged helix-turn-helix transcriptional regulator [Ralstonia insidiosa]ANJ75941.1 MarR family transcriptional regulator [Ralstonia insidiosa]KAB0469252.1 winged helix-turn-helix transcriptional regulator [Ralstonia insidiosa]MBY4909922.1 MarR family winged helix-turn-helix transcriptional regulator [Ralstonia insidiosa]
MFDHCLYFNTTALARTVEREWTAAYAPLSLTPPQGFVLRVVLKRPGVLNRELAEVLGIARPTATRLVDGLIAKGLVERQPSAEDGREWNLFPTDAARAMEAALQAASAKVARRLREHVGTNVFDDTVQALRDVRSALNT